MVKSIEIIVRGDVQGVGYRAYAVRNARQLNIKGYVKNLFDGSVKVVAVGEDFAIRRFFQLLESGPRHSSIHEIECGELDTVKEYEEFNIEY